MAVILLVLGVVLVLGGAVWGLMNRDDIELDEPRTILSEAREDAVEAGDTGAKWFTAFSGTVAAAALLFGDAVMAFVQTAIGSPKIAGMLGITGLGTFGLEGWVPLSGSQFFWAALLVLVFAVGFSEVRSSA